MNCACHGEPMLWNRDIRYRAGGFWRCRIANRERMQRNYDNEAVRDRKLAGMRDRYDRDPVYRIGRRLREDARKRAATLKRRRENLGALQN